MASFYKTLHKPRIVAVLVALLVLSAWLLLGKRETTCFSTIGDRIPSPVDEVRFKAFQGDAWAENMLAYYIQYPAACRPDCPQANYGGTAKWYRKAAEQGNTAAQRNLAELYLNDGVPEDLKEAYFWILVAWPNRPKDPTGSGAVDCSYELLRKKIEELLPPPARNEIEDQVSRFTPKVETLKADEIQAAKDDLKTNPLYLKAQHGESASQGRLGELYEKFPTLRQNIIEAYFWYSLAAKTDPTSTVFKTRRDSLGTHLDQGEINAVTARLTTWKPSP